MLKIIFCIKRKAGLTRAEFRQHWREHAKIVAAASGPMGIRRNIQNHTVETALDERIRTNRGAEMDDYDGVAESWFASMDALMAATATEEGRRHARLVAEDEARFVDFSRSRVFFVEEHTAVGE
jgi:hypothetical protein